MACFSETLTRNRDGCDTRCVVLCCCCFFLFSLSFGSGVRECESAMVLSGVNTAFWCVTRSAQPGRDIFWPVPIGGEPNQAHVDMARSSKAYLINLTS